MLDLADPEQPLDPEAYLGNLFGATPARPGRKLLRRLLVAVVLIAIGLLLWRYTPLVEWADPDRVAALLARVETSAWSGPIVVLAFIVGGLVAFPVRNRTGVLRNGV